MTTTTRPPTGNPAFTFTDDGPFDLAAVARFLVGKLPIADRPPTDGDVVRLAFVPDGSAEAPAGVVLRPVDHGVTVEITETGDAGAAAVADQVRRMLSLDVPGAGFAEVGRRDPVIGRLQAEEPGLRMVNYLSPYEAAAWFLIGHRIRMSQASTIKGRLTVELGPALRIDGHEHHAFPGPAVLSRLGPTAGLTDRKVANLRALGEAALHTDLLDGATIRRRGAAASIAALQELPGVGPFTAEGIVLRGAGEPDHLTLVEPRLAQAVQEAYDLDRRPTPDELVERSAAWRPYRTWVTFLLRVAQERAS
jgi:DNA-3-methyladenine glycosylase II